MRNSGPIWVAAGVLILTVDLLRPAVWQAGVLFGFLLVVIGGLLIADAPRRGRARRIEQRRRARNGYLPLGPTIRGRR